MKKQLFRILSGVIPAIAIFSSAVAQVESNSPAPDFFKENVTYVTETAANTTGGTDAAEVNMKAQKDFIRKFKNAGNASWYTIKNGLLVKFEQDGIKVRAFYDAKGRPTATLRTYEADKLPREIHKQVTVAYYGYTIYLVNELTVGDKTAYLVSIKDDENVKIIRVTEDEMDVYEEFKKI